MFLWSHNWEIAVFQQRTSINKYYTKIKKKNRNNNETNKKKKNMANNFHAVHDHIADIGLEVDCV